MLRLVLVAISGVCWSAVYIDSIRIGFRQKLCAMPLFALALNIAWEGIYSGLDFFVRGEISAQAVANAAWFLLDIAIVVTYFKFARSECTTDAERRFFVPWSVLVFASCLVLQLLFVVQFGDVEGEKYSAFLQNLIMSVCYLYMLRDRGGSRGQSMLIAVSKCVGTLTPTIIGGMEGNLFIVVTGIICFIFDAIYIVALRCVRRGEIAREPAES
ncbi:hypothetical protein BE0216_01615 [Bifidobacterium eulemuris]|nr:hypothetical protein BE0216_01615 [Bifidobacterium eulemuris]